MWMKPKNGLAARVALLSSHVIMIPPEGRDVPEMFVKAAGDVATAMSEDEIAAVQKPKGDTGAGKAEPDPPLPSLLSKGDQSVEEPGGKIERIKAAIKAALEAGDDSIMTSSGVPDARKLDRLVGEPVSAAERNQAWEELKVEAEFGAD